ncbi:MAG: hypothetical protein IJ789_01815 [Bacteroidales bacterium]|nr:hypothetical protein [Bacteroidales bacterium]
MNPDKRDELYKNLIGSGKVSEAEIGSIDDFKTAVKDEGSAREFHKNLLGSGLFGEDEIGSEDDFFASIQDDFAERVGQQPTAEQPDTAGVAAPDEGAGMAAMRREPKEVYRQAEGQVPVYPYEGDAAPMSGKGTGNESGAATDEGAGQGAPQQGEEGPLGPEKFAKSMEIQQQVGQMQQDFSQRLENMRKSNQPFGGKPEDVLAPARKVRMQREVEKKAQEGIELATMEMRQGNVARETWESALSRAGSQWRFGRPVSNEAARLKETDIDKMMDEAWLRMDDGLKERSIRNVSRVLAEVYGIRGDEAQRMAERVVRGESDRLMYEQAVEGEMPRSWAEHILNKVNGNTIGSLLEGWARAKAGTIGDMQARDEASQLYGRTHRVADIAGGVGAVGFDVATLFAGGLGGGAAKGAIGLLGAGGRKFAEKAVGKAVTGVVAGAANLAAFESIGEGANQVKYGGELKVDETSGRYVVDGYNAGKILSQAGRGALLGVSTGATGALIGNAFGKVYEGVSSTAGKIGVRVGQTATSIAAEGTIFAMPEFLEGDGDWDTWLESVEMMAGFKVSGAVKNLPKTYETLKKKPESRAGFETRLRTLLDGEPGLALTKDEREELEKGGYGDLADLVKGYKQTSKGQREAMERRQPIYLEPNEDGEIPYNRFLELMEDESISEAARAKMHYYVSGHKLPQSTVTGVTFTEHTDADGKVTGYTVEALGAGGNVIVSRDYTSLREAEEARDRYIRQSELNGIKMAEGVHDQVHEKMEDGITAEGVRKGVNKEYGVEIDAALGKEPNRRSEQEKRAIEEYIRRLAGNEKKDVSLSAERQLPYGTQTSDTENDSELGIRPDTSENQPTEDSETASNTWDGRGGVREEVPQRGARGSSRGSAGSVEERLAVELDGDYVGGSQAEQAAYGLQTIERAKEQGLYIDPATLSSYGERYKKGTGESVVYIDEANGRVVKVKDPFAKAPMKGHATGDALYEHLVHNLLFPGDEYRLLGVTEINGEMRLVLEQDYVDFFRNATQEEVEKYLTEELGLQREGKYWWGNDLLSITDVDAESDNVIVDAEGKLHFIDPIIKLKVPAREILGEAMSSPVDEAYNRGRNADAEGRRDIAMELAMADEGNRGERQAAWDGVRAKIEDEAEETAAKERERLSQMAYKVDGEPDGTVRPVMMKELDEEGHPKEMFLVDGEVVMADDGRTIDGTASDETVVVYDPATGKKKMVSPRNDILWPGAVVQAADMERDIEARRELYIRQQLDEAQGTVQVEPGQAITIPDGQQATVVAADGETITIQTADGQQTTVPLAEVQRIADELALADYQARHPEAAEVDGGADRSDGIVEGAPADFTPDMEITIVDEDGNERPATVLGRVRYESGQFVPDESGPFVEYMVDGQVKHDYVGELAEKVVSHVEAPATEEAAIVSPEMEEEGNARVATPDEGELAEQPATDTMPMREDGEADFMATTPERGHQFIYNEAGLSREEAGQFVKANIEAAEKELSKLKGKAPKMGTSLTKYQQQKAEHQARVDAAQATLDYWNGVRDVQRGIDNAEAAERAERDKAAHDAAVVAEQRRQAEELAKRAEQEARGSNSVAPQITERWNAVPKVEGVENEITLAGGETIKGRYVLVESGAATRATIRTWSLQGTRGSPWTRTGRR